MHAIFRYSLTLLLSFAHPAYTAEPDQPDSFDLGRPVDAEEIATWDIDVRPDGRGLPAGKGSVQQGAQIFGQKCAFCHGENGVEGPFDVLVGRLPDDAFPFGRENHWQLLALCHHGVRLHQSGHALQCPRLTAGR